MYELHAPLPPLQPYINNYWMLRSPPGQPMALEERIFVDAHADLMFVLGASYERSSTDGRAQTMRATHLDAQRNYPVLIAQQGVIDLVGVRFRPGGLAALLQVPINEISNLTIDMPSAFGHDASDLESQLAEAKTNLDRTALLDSFFCKRLAPADSQVIALYMAQTIEAAKGNIRVADISAQFGYSIRSVDRLFQQVIGFSPKAYARIARFQRALVMVSAPTAMPLIEIALMCGYYDQSHFTRDFTDFSGTTPQRYRQQILARQAALPPNLVQILQEENAQTF